MSRYVDTEELIADLDKGLWGKDYDKSLAEAIIIDAPSIEIVRCGECRRWNEDDEYCDGVIYGHTCADDYCSYGERKEGE